MSEPHRPTKQLESRVTQAPSDNGPWPQIAPATLADRVYHVVRHRILQRELSPGTFIREQEVSQATGVSRTPVREALSRLASQDFLERVPHRGFRVPERPWEALLEVYPIVAALEKLAGEHAFSRLTKEDIRRLERLNRQLADAGAKGNAKRQAELNNRFHEVLSAKSGNQRLSELLSHLRAQVSLLDVWYFSIPEHVAASLKEHSELIKAIQAGDQALALELLEINYDRGRRALEVEMGRSKGEFQPEL